MLKSLVLLAMIVCHASGKMLTASEVEEVLKIHNDLRRAEGASNMKELKWDPVLEKTAKAWVDKCVWRHGQPEDIKTNYDYVGQNLYATSAKSVNMTSGTLSWFSEKKYYDLENNKCSDVCGHYTQVVWADSEFVGCAASTCEHIENLKFSGTIYLCNYGPAGNFDGQKPYELGAACSQCEPGYGCQNGLCYKP